MPNRTKRRFKKILKTKIAPKKNLNLLKNLRMTNKIYSLKISTPIQMNPLRTKKMKIRKIKSMKTIINKFKILGPKFPSKFNK